MSWRRGRPTDRDLSFFAPMNSEQETRKDGGIPVDVSFSLGKATFAIANNKITFPTVHFGDAFSIRAIVTPDNVNGTKYIFSKAYSGKNGPVILYDENVIRFYPNASGGNEVSAALAATRVEIVATWDGSNAELYVNSIEGATAGSPIAPDNFTDDIILGLKYDDTGDFAGEMELVEVYNKALTLEEITNLGNNARYVVPNLEHEEQVGADLNISNCENDGYTAFTNATPNGFDAISDGSAQHRAGTADEISVVDGQRYKVVFGRVLNSGSAPAYELRDSLSGASICDEGAQTAVAGTNTFVFTANATTVGVIRFVNFSSVTNYEITNLTVGHKTVNLTSKILHVNAFQGIARNLLSGDTIGGELVPEVVVTDVEVVKEGSIRVPRFNLAGSMIDCGSYSDLTGDVTIMFWFKPGLEGSVTTNGRILNNGKFNLLYYYGNTVLDRHLGLQSDGVSLVTPNPNTVPIGEYTFVVVTRNATGGATFYFNGEADGNGVGDTGIPEAGTTNIIVGNQSTGGRNANEIISEVQVISGLLASEEISQYFSSTKHLYNK